MTMEPPTAKPPQEVRLQYRRFHEAVDGRKVAATASLHRRINKLRAMLTFLQDMQDPEKLRAFPLWKAHQLTGDRKGVWSLHLTRDWQLTFQMKSWK